MQKKGKKKIDMIFFYNAGIFKISFKHVKMQEPLKLVSNM